MKTPQEFAEYRLPRGIDWYEELAKSIIDARNAPDMGLQSANDQLIYDAIDRADALLSQSTDKP